MSSRFAVQIPNEVRRQLAERRQFVNRMLCLEFLVLTKRQTAIVGAPVREGILSPFFRSVEANEVRYEIEMKWSDKYPSVTFVAGEIGRLPVGPARVNER